MTEEIVVETLPIPEKPMTPWAPDPKLWAPAFGVMGLTSDRNALRLTYLAEGISHVTGGDKAIILAELMDPKQTDKHVRHMSLTLGSFMGSPRDARLAMPIGFAREVYYYRGQVITIVSDSRDGLGETVDQQGLCVKVEFPLTGETSFYHLLFHSKP